MLLEVIAVVGGGALGFGATWAYLAYALKEERAREEEVRKVKLSTVTSTVEPKVESKMEKPPEDLSEFVDYISKKYILSEVTLLTPEGLPIVSNSATPEEDAAVAPELLKVGQGMLNSNKLLLSGENTRVIVLQVNPEVILYAKVARDISRREMDRIIEETRLVLEGIV